MAKKEFDQSTLAAGKEWLAKVFFPVAEGKTLDENIVDTDNKKLYIETCSDCYLDITNRLWMNSNGDNTLNDELTILAKAKYNLQGKTGLTFTEEWFAELFAFMCASCGIYWDDTIVSKMEYNLFLKKSKLAKALYAYGAFETLGGNTPEDLPKAEQPKVQPEPVATTEVAQPGEETETDTTVATAAQSAEATPTETGTVQTTVAANKASKLNIVRDLKSTDRVNATKEVYKVVTTDKPKKEVRLFIRPVSKSGAAGNTNQVLLGNSTGYDDITCIFLTPADADAFMGAYKAVDSNVDLQVVKSRPHANGYFEVGTNCGNCYIAAVKINEALEEAIDSSSEELDEASANIKDVEYYNNKIKQAFAALDDFMD